MNWNLSATYLNLPEVLHHAQVAHPVAAPKLLVFNTEAARALGLLLPGETGPTADDVAILGGNANPPGSTPFAQAYAGHQYGHFTNLGDGRALVLGELVDPAGQRWDVQLKGSGRTPFSRSGDGRAALGPMLREFLMGEALYALGLPTTRALAVVETGELVRRDGFLPGAVLARLAHSHIRVGTFQYAAAVDDPELLQTLLDYTVARHYPELQGRENRALAFFQAVQQRQAQLVARWMGIGFVHGVMNTDNMAISGQTIDFGPCAFLDEYYSKQVFSSIDQYGRYAYGNQPVIAHWNLARLAEALLPLIHSDGGEAVRLAQAALEDFTPQFEAAWQAEFAAKLGLAPTAQAAGLAQELLALMEEGRADFTATFAALTDCANGAEAPESLRALAGFADWEARWRRELANGQPARMVTANPVVMARNWWTQAALDQAEAGDDSLFFELLAAVRQPFDPEGRHSRFFRPRPEGTPDEEFVTFCGT